MKNKVYIMDNEEQEQNILTKLENEGCVWHSDSTKPTEYIPSKHFIIGEHFPIAIVRMLNNRLMCDTNYEDGNIKQNEEIIYDGRKESKMKISKEVYDALVDWRNVIESSNTIYAEDINGLASPYVVRRWWIGDDDEGTYANNRLIAIIRWVNGEDVFEVEKPKKWVVRSKEPQGSVDGKPLYAWFVDEYTVELEATMPPYVDRFDTKEEAESWANSHQEVIEVEE